MSIIVEIELFAEEIFGAQNRKSIVVEINSENSRIVLDKRADKLFVFLDVLAYDLLNESERNNAFASISVFTHVDESDFGRSEFIVADILPEDDRMSTIFSDDRTDICDREVRPREFVIEPFGEQFSVSFNKRLIVGVILGEQLSELVLIVIAAHHFDLTGIEVRDKDRKAVKHESIDDRIAPVEHFRVLHIASPLGKIGIFIFVIIAQTVSIFKT